MPVKRYVGGTEGAKKELTRSWTKGWAGRWGWRALNVVTLGIPLLSRGAYRRIAPHAAAWRASASVSVMNRQREIAVSEAAEQRVEVELKSLGEAKKALSQLAVNLSHERRDEVGIQEHFRLAHRALHFIDRGKLKTFKSQIAALIVAFEEISKLNSMETSEGAKVRQATVTIARNKEIAGKDEDEILALQLASLRGSTFKGLNNIARLANAGHTTGAPVVAGTPIPPNENPHYAELEAKIRALAVNARLQAGTITSLETDLNALSNSLSIFTTGANRAASIAEADLREILELIERLERSRRGNDAVKDEIDDLLEKVKREVGVIHQQMLNLGSAQIRLGKVANRIKQVDIANFKVLKEIESLEVELAEIETKERTGRGWPVAP
jgi:hypothetical protein